MSQHSSSNGSKHWLWLLLIPFVAVLWVPWYNSVEPQLGGFPFFYWYQLAWVLISAVLTAFVYFKTKPNNKAGDAR
jgi:hypothetical protein